MIINVTQYNNFLKALLDNEPMLAKIGVTGEVSDFSVGAENAYFCLKDENSKMDCFAYLDKLPCLLQKGSQVLIEGRPNFLKSGKISFIVSKLTLTDSQGEQYQRFLKLKAELEKKGYFDISKKRTLPRYVFNVAVVTSVSGAVIHDICKVLSRRNKYAHITALDARVQGDDASRQIANAIEKADKGKFDAIIVARGGGSNEDLSAFNSVEVAEAVFNCSTPIISAVGHETDYTICDFCADLRASTPSVAAELISENSVCDDLSVMLENMMVALKSKLLTKATDFRRNLNKINLGLNDKMTKAKNAISANLSRSRYFCEKKLIESENGMSFCVQKLILLSPQKVLQGGRAFVERNGKRIFEAKQLSKGDKITVMFTDGKISATVEE